MILDLLFAFADCIAVAASFAVLIFGVCGILFAIGSLLHDLMDCEEDEEE